MPLLEVKNACKDFGGVHALKNIDLSIERGQIIGLIGPNGAGKTSFFNGITGLLPIDSGQILFDEGKTRLDGLPSHRILEKGVARTFQNLRIFRNMSVWENVAVGFHARTKSGLWDAFLRTARYRREEKHIHEKSYEKICWNHIDSFGFYNPYHYFCSSRHSSGWNWPYMGFVSVDWRRYSFNIYMDNRMERKTKTRKAI